MQAQRGASSRKERQLYTRKRTIFNDQGGRNRTTPTQTLPRRRRRKNNRRVRGSGSGDKGYLAHLRWIGLFSPRIITAECLSTCDEREKRERPSTRPTLQSGTVNFNEEARLPFRRTRSLQSLASLYSADVTLFRSSHSPSRSVCSSLYNVETPTCVYTQVWTQPDFSLFLSCSASFSLSASKRRRNWTPAKSEPGAAREKPEPFSLSHIFLSPTRPRRASTLQTPAKTSSSLLVAGAINLSSHF